jgi:DNA-binding NtrC family response regulator
VVNALVAHAWPGNIRELRNTIDRAVLLSKGGPVRVAHLALDPRRRDSNPTMPIPRISDDGSTLAAAVADLERQRIIQTLDAHGGNQTRAARALGISRNTLLARLDTYGITRPRKT